jgi:hypothetical protein
MSEDKDELIKALQARINRLESEVGDLEDERRSLWNQLDDHEGRERDWQDEFKTTSLKLVDACERHFGSNFYVVDEPATVGDVKTAMEDVRNWKPGR